MKRDEVFEVLEPPPHGLTRLRARMNERRASRAVWRALAVSAAVVLAGVVLWPRQQVRAPDFTAYLAGLTATGAPVEGRGETAVELLASRNAEVVVYRASTSR